MRFFHMGKQLEPSEIKIWMLEQQRLFVDHSKDPEVDWPPHIKKEIQKAWRGLPKTLEKIKVGPVWPLYIILFLLWACAIWLIWR